jgi:class 3 adenylate cyclase
MFERMVSPAVINHLDPHSLKLGGHRAEITVLFADIRGFTAFSETLDPETLVAVLNSHLAAAAEAVLGQEGTIDKFLGDAVMAWFNAPVPQPDHAQRAARAALAIRAAVENLHRSLPPEFHLSYGVGIHTGEAVLGLVGSEQRLEYTAVGDSVNTARRIQENCAAGQILASAATCARLGGIARLKPVEPISAKGKRDPIEVCEVVGLR